MASPESDVVGKLDTIGFPRERTKVKRGWINEVIKTNDLPLQVAFAYVDFDFYEPISDALNFIDARMQAGGSQSMEDTMLSRNKAKEMKRRASQRRATHKARLGWQRQPKPERVRRRSGPKDASNQR